MRNSIKYWIVPIALLGAALPARADEHMPPVDNETVQKECGGCHMAFQPQFLPTESWRKIMIRLPNHFGSKVDLSGAKHREIEDYHLSNAADVSDSPEGRRFYQSIGNRPAPLRITHVPHWYREHSGEVTPSALTDTQAGKKSNCLACHRGAEAGYYEGS